MWVKVLATGERKVIVNGGTDARYVPTGHLVYVREGTLLAVPFNLDQLEVTGGSVPVAEGVAQASGQTGAAHFSFSSEGSLVYVPGGPAGLGQNNLIWVDRNGMEEPLDAPPGPIRPFGCPPTVAESPSQSAMPTRISGSMKSAGKH